MAQLPVRLIVCVDGTWCDPDGAHGSRNRNITNIYRIFVSVRRGVCRDPVNGREYDQRKIYLPGIGAEDGMSFAQRLHVGIHGKRALEQIRDVYRQCCQLTGPEDEVWLFGFSRGAYAVRAVAGLLHYVQSLVSQGDPSIFEKEYKEVLKVYAMLQKHQKLGEGVIHHRFAAKTRPAPRIRFVGVFDTVKAVSDKNLYDISFNHSIQHMRHALALNETRDHFQPEYVFPDYSNRHGHLLSRSFVQAWFIGAHMDMGGSTDCDGLALYPLQWMLIEARDLGLCLAFDGNFGGRSTLENPLHILALEPQGEEQEPDVWFCTTENKITVKMPDIRSTHNPKGKHKHGTRYQILSHQKKAIGWPKSPRQPFDSDANLNGYCGFAAQGTILHPSVYLLRDEYANDSLNIQMFGFKNGTSPLEKWRPKMLGDGAYEVPNQGFWNIQVPVSLQNPGAIRILVCGNCGVGKSTLINTVFGDEVTTAEDRNSGKHDIRKELTNPDRPDIIVHDSGGFEAGAVEQFEVVENFLKENSEKLDIDERIHVIWFCLDASSDRNKQTATQKLFQTVSQHAQGVPIVVVATKKDRLFDSKVGEYRRSLKKQNIKHTLEQVEELAEKDVQERVQQIEEDLLSLENGRFDACVAVSKDDDESIGELTKTTAQCFTHDRVRLLYVRAQVTRIDLKISLALDETMSVYRRILKAATASGGIPLGASSSRVGAVIQICRSILTCFGLPGVSAETVLQICKANLLDDLGNSVSVLLAEGVAALSMGATVLSGGMPFFLIPMAVNFAAVVPATTRLFLMLACDLILVLTRAFQEAASKCVGQPLKRDVEMAAVAYGQQCCSEVHDRVRKLVPRLKVLKSFKTDVIAAGIAEIVQEYKKKVVQDVGAPPSASAPSSYGRVRHATASMSKLSLMSEGSETTNCEKEDIVKATEWIQTRRVLE